MVKMVPSGFVLYTAQTSVLSHFALGNSAESLWGDM